MQDSGLDTQPKLEKKSGIGQSTISRLLNLEQGATVDMLDSLARAFGVMSFELLADSEHARNAAYARMILGPRVSDERAAETLPPAPSHEPPEPKTDRRKAIAKSRRKPPKRRNAPPS